MLLATSDAGAATVAVAPRYCWILHWLVFSAECFIPYAKLPKYYQTDDTVSRIIFWTLIPKRLITFQPPCDANRIGFYRTNNGNNWKKLVRSCHRWKWICTLTVFWLTFAQNIREKNSKKIQKDINFVSIFPLNQSITTKYMPRIALQWDNGANNCTSVVNCEHLIHVKLFATQFNNSIPITHSIDSKWTNERSICSALNRYQLISIYLHYKISVLDMVGIYFFSPTLSFNKRISK